MTTATLLAWSAENRIQIDPALQLVDTLERGVYARDELIPPDRTLVYIPKSAVLSVRSSAFSQIPFVPYGHGAQLSLALALYGELLRGTRSRWFGYLQSLPQETVDIAMFWGLDEARKCTCSSGRRWDPAALQPSSHSQCPSCVSIHDIRHATGWFQVTEIDREQVGLMDEIRQYYVDVVEPTFRAAPVAHPESIPGKVSFPGYCHAYSLVSTRAFWVDAYHGLAMVPIADAFNHTNDNHVQMETDYDVCVECGSLTECEHDEHETTARSLPSSQHDAAEVDHVEMRTVRAIPPLAEVFNTYGCLPNAALLARYGFTLPENEHDTVRMVPDPLSTAKNLFKYVGLETVSVGRTVACASACDQVGIRNTLRTYVQGAVNNEATSESVGVDKTSAGGATVDPSDGSENTVNRLLSCFVYVAGAWTLDATWGEEQGLVFNAPSMPVSFQAGDASVRISHDLVINSDGKLSHNLWLFCTLIALFAARTHYGASFEELMKRIEGGDEGIGWLREFKERIIGVHGYVEGLGHVDDGDSDDGNKEGGGNQGSTCPPLPHPGSSSPTLDYETERAQPATTCRAQLAIEAGTTSITARSVPRSPEGVVMGQPLETGPRDPGGFSSIPQQSFMAQVRSVSSHPMQQATRETYQARPSFAMSTSKDRAGGRHERSLSAETERPAKRVRRRYSDAVAARRGSGRADGLGKTTAEIDQDTRLLADLLVRTVVGLCQDRYRPPTVREGQRGVGMTAAELGELLDDVPDGMERTRRVVELAMGERSMVESCSASWAERSASLFSSVSPIEGTGTEKDK